LTVDVTSCIVLNTQLIHTVILQSLTWLCNKIKERKIQLSRNLAKATVIVLALLMASCMLLAMPAQAQQVLPSGVTPTNVQDGGSIPLPAGVTPDYTVNTRARLSFRPNPVGINQPFIVNIWTEPPVHGARFYRDFKVTMTKPDGSTVEVMKDSYYADSTAWFEYVADQLGTWKIKFDFPGGYFPPGNYTSEASFTLMQIFSFEESIYYEPSSDGPYDLVVQTEQVRSWPSSALPTDYWTRPISPENREWYVIGGNYPWNGYGGGPDWPANTNTYASNYQFTPYVQAPNTAHIVWKRQDKISGIIGGADAGITSLANGGVNPAIIYDGRAYDSYAKPGSTSAADLASVSFTITSTSYWRCYDIRTGEVYWERPIPAGESVPNLITYYYEPPFVRAGGVGVPGSQARNVQIVPSLMSVGARLVKYDPYTGAVTLNVTGMSGTLYRDPFVLSVQTNNSAAGYRLINWSTALPSTNFQDRIESNISWPFSSLGVVDYEAGIAVTTAAITPPAAGVAYGYRIMAANIISGQLLWNVTTDLSDATQGFFSGSTSVADHGKFAVRENDGHWHCWDLATGHVLWTSELTSHPWGVFGCYGVQSYGGNIISNQYDGVVGYDWDTGKIAWWYQYKAPYPYETPYGDNYPWFTPGAQIADGKLYTFNTEHTPTQPVMRGWKLHCINVTTGEGIWNITGPMNPGAVADGYLAASNTYDGYEYVFGKGKSVTTVTTPDVVIPKGNGVVIKGTVLDMSPAQPGTPCVSKESMATQMEYLHMQLPIDGLDHNITMTGVPVLLTAIDSNGGYIDIGTATTSAYYGTFEMAWTPPAEGTYRIVASFVGDDSYGSSAAANAVAVGPATPTQETPEIPTPVDNTMLLYGLIVLVVIAIIIGLVALFRKR
jgi:hypothetical protein